MKISSIFAVALIGSVLAFSSCSKKVQRNLEEGVVVYPAPPDTTRIQYLTSFSSSTALTGGRSGFARFLMGDLPDLEIVKPYGIAVKDGKVYITDTQLNALEIADLENHTFEYFTPKGMGQLKKPINCFVDDENKLYVTDTKRRQVVVYDENGQYLTSLGDGFTGKPSDVFVTKNKIWVADFTGHAVKVYDRNTYELIGSIPDAELTKEGSEDFLYSPLNLYVTDEYLYVTDFGDFKIKQYTLDGEFVRSVGSYGKKIGQFVRPKGIAVDREGNLYVVDAGFENVQIFNKDGKILMFFGGPYQGPGDMWLPAKVIVDYDNLKYFEHLVNEQFKLKYLIFVTNQYGPDKINVYGFVEPK